MCARLLRSFSDMVLASDSRCESAAAIATSCSTSTHITKPFAAEMQRLTAWSSSRSRPLASIVVRSARRGRRSPAMSSSIAVQPRPNMLAFAPVCDAAPKRLHSVPHGRAPGRPSNVRCLSSRTASSIGAAWKVWPNDWDSARVTWRACSPSISMHRRCKWRSRYACSAPNVCSMRAIFRSPRWQSDPASRARGG